MLAPIPLEHLREGFTVCKEKGRVAFRSNALDVFSELDEFRDGRPIDVYIYASHSDAPSNAKITWQARYINHVQGSRNRVNPTEKYKERWAVFWEVEGLKELSTKDCIDISDLKNRKNQRGFAPRGPIIILHP